MRVLVVGAGAVGGYFGGQLANAGRDVTFLVRSKRATELAANGFAIVAPNGAAHSIAIRTVLSEQIEAPYDLVLLSCKAYDLESAMAGLAPAVGPETAILPLLNGMRHIDALSERFGAARVLGGLCVISATLNGQGHVVRLGPMTVLTFGELDGGCSDRVNAIEAAISDAGFEARLSDAVRLEMWEKWVMLATFAGMTCLMRAAIGDIVAADAAGLVERLLDECRRIAAHHGQIVRPDSYARIRAMFTQAGSTITASMLRDIENNARTEAEHVFGDLLCRTPDSSDASLSLLQISYAHLRAYEARRAREAAH
jgi:2-dehydropantoate 2-reductase